MLHAHCCQPTHPCTDGFQQKRYYKSLEDAAVAPQANQLPRLTTSPTHFLSSTCSKLSSFSRSPRPLSLLNTLFQTTMSAPASSMNGASKPSATPPTDECKSSSSKPFLVLTYHRNYVDQGTAQSLNLSYASGNSFVMKADSTTTLSASGPGRNSVRIQSNKQYTTSVVM